MSSSSTCNTCGQPQTSCACSTVKPIAIKACTPGAFQKVTWGAWTSQCWPKGMAFCVVDGPCPGIYIGTGSEGVAGDLVLKNEHIGAGLVWDAATCKITVDWDAVCEAAEVADPTELSNLIFCNGSAKVKKATLSDFLAEACFTLGDFDPSNCGEITSVGILIVDGCQKFVPIPATALRIAANTTNDTFPAPYGSPTSELIPNNPAASEQGVSYYRWTQLSADAGTNTVDWALADNTLLIESEEFTLGCDARIEIVLRAQVEYTPLSEGSSYISYAIDDGSGYYIPVNSTGTARVLGNYTNQMDTPEPISTEINLAAGTYRIKCFVTGRSGGTAAAQVSNWARVTGTGAISSGVSLFINKSVG